MAARRELSKRRTPTQPEPTSEDIRLVTASSLFDERWYALVSGADRPRKAAVLHYLTRGRPAGLPPHPLFDPDYFAAQHAASIGTRDPLVLYLAKRSSRRVSPHPLFDLEGYVARVPHAEGHQLGPLGHYIESGAANGLLVNDWYVPDPEREPRGLIGWIEARAIEWASRQRPSALVLGDRREPRPGTGSDVRGGSQRVSVVLVMGDDPSLVPAMVETVRRQTIEDWELLVVLADDSEPSTELGGATEDARIRLVRSEPGDHVAALARGLAEANGEFIAWLSGGDRWDERRLERAVAELSRPGVDTVVDLVALHSDSDDKTAPGRGPAPAWPGPAAPAGVTLAWSPDWTARGWYPELAALVVRRELALEVGGFDGTVHRAAGHDFFLKVAARSSPVLIETIGVQADGARRQQDIAVRPVRERPSLELSSVATWHDVVLSRHLVPWDALIERQSEPGVVSVVIPTFRDWRMTTDAVRSVHAAARDDERTVRTIVLDNGSDVTSSVVLASLPLRFPNVEVLSSAVNHGFALGNNLAMRAADGEFVVFLNNDTEVTPGWLEPLIESLAEPAVLGAQALLLYPDGTIQSAGVAFPSCGGLPHALLQGFARLDAAGLSQARFSALTAAAMAMRRRDFLEMRGFDALFRNGMEDVDLGLRMTRERDGHFVVRADSIVVHHESRTPGRFATSLANRRILLDRWRDQMPGDDVDLWSRVGYEVVRHDLGPHVSEDRRLTPPVPILRRFPVITPVDAERPSLRWAIKNPAPNDPSAEFWGDTHFARLLAAALEGLGQQVVIDHRPAFERPSGTLDDVVVVLRGVAPYRPQYGQINLGWLISHPEMMSRHEASSYDRLFAASVVWAAEASRAWGIRVDPLLQATDPVRFNPDRGRPDTGHPVLFVGSSRRTLRPIVRDAISAGMPVAIFGREWEGLVPERYVKAEYLAHDEVGAAYRTAGLVLNDHWEDMRIAGFLSNRLFDAVGSGARVITDDVAGLGELFGRSVQVARDEADLAWFAALSDLDEVFGDNAERRAVAARIHAEHSFAVRAEALLDAALELRSKLGGVPPRRETRASEPVG